MFCRSPLNPQGDWTWMNAGVLFIRNTPAMLAYLKAVLTTDLEVVRAWWDADVYELFTNGDQDATVYSLVGPDTQWRDSFLQMPWESFNARPYHYTSTLDEHFVCHFTRDGRPKEEVITAFADRMSTTPGLCSRELLEPYRVFLENSDLGSILAITSPGPSLPPPAAPPVPPSLLARAIARIQRTLSGRDRSG